MALADDIRSLKDRAVADLIATHDYNADTQTAWQIVRNWVSAGNSFTVRNVTTGTTTADADLVAKARGYVLGYLAEATFQQSVAIFETFVADLLRTWLVATPDGLLPQGKKDEEMKIGLSAVLQAADKGALIRSLVERRVTGVLYGRPAAWFNFLKRVTRVDVPTGDEVARLGEAKATRDILVHNRGFVEQQYLEKAGTRARGKVGDRIEVTEEYHRATWELLRKVVTDVADAAVAKAP